MKAIYKYPIDLKPRQIINVNTNRILSVGEQEGRLVVYAPFEEYPSNEWFEILILGTGEQAPDDIDYFNFLGTVFFSQNGFVWHIFYRWTVVQE